jgi:hypothetical protein
MSERYEAGMQSWRALGMLGEVVVFADHIGSIFGVRRMSPRRLRRCPVEMRSPM